MVSDCIEDEYNNIKGSSFEIVFLPCCVYYIWCRDQDGNFESYERGASGDLFRWGYCFMAAKIRALFDSK